MFWFVNNVEPDQLAYEKLIMIYSVSTLLVNTKEWIESGEHLKGL